MYTLVKEKGGFFMIDPINETGRRLQNLRKEKNLTQKKVSEIICVAETSYISWELGEIVKETVKDENGKRKRKNTPYRKAVNIGSQYIVALADLYNVSTDYILGRSPFRSIDGADIAKITGLSDEAIDILKLCGADNADMGYHHARDVSQLLVDWHKNGSNSLLSIITRYANCPDAPAKAFPDTGNKFDKLNTVETDWDMVLLCGITIAAANYRKDYQDELKTHHID